MALLRISLVAWLLIGLTSNTFAQDVTRGPVTATMKFQWNAPPNTTLSEQNTWVVRLRDSLSPSIVTELQAFTCTLVNSVVTCQKQLTQANADALNVVGIHNLTVSYFRADVGDSPQSGPFALTSPAGAPTGTKIVQ